MERQFLVSVRSPASLWACVLDPFSETDWKPQRTFHQSLPNSCREIYSLGEERGPNQNGGGRVFCHWNLRVHRKRTSCRKCSVDLRFIYLCLAYLFYLLGRLFALCQDRGCSSCASPVRNLVVNVFGNWLMISLSSAKGLLKTISKEFGTLPFCRRYLDRVGETKYLLAVSDDGLDKIPTINWHYGNGWIVEPSCGTRDSTGLSPVMRG